MQKHSIKVIGVGLNRTGTKTLGYYLKTWGFRHKSYDLDAFHLLRAGRIDELLGIMSEYDSFEDWPWPLMFREIDAYFPNARFILTMRRSPDVWYRSLCNMAVRMGPLHEFEKHIYGYAMPQGHREEHLQYYREHNQAVEEHFQDRPMKLLKICWENGFSTEELANFLGIKVEKIPPQRVNRSSRAVYNGDNLYLAHTNRVFYQTWWYAKRRARRMLNVIRQRLSSNTS